MKNLALALLLALPLAAREPAIVDGREFHELCSRYDDGPCSSLSRPPYGWSVDGRVYTENPASRYVFAPVGKWDATVTVWVSSDGGETRRAAFTIKGTDTTPRGEPYQILACGPCLIGADVSEHVTGKVEVAVTMSGESWLAIYRESR